MQVGYFGPSRPQNSYLWTARLSVLISISGANARRTRSDQIKSVADVVFEKLGARICKIFKLMDLAGVLCNIGKQKFCKKGVEPAPALSF